MAKLPPFECPEIIKSPSHKLACLAKYSLASVCPATSGEYVIRKSSFQPISVSSVPLNTTSLTLGSTSTVMAANCFVVSLSQTLTTPKNFNDWKRGASAITCDTSCRSSVIIIGFSSNNSCLCSCIYSAISFTVTKSSPFSSLGTTFSSGKYSNSVKTNASISEKALSSNETCPNSLI